MLFAMMFPIWLLAVSIDVEGWVQRMGQDLACFLILASAFTFGYVIKGLEWLVQKLENRTGKIKINKINPKITFTICLAVLLVIPMIFPNIAMGKTLEPIVKPEAVEDLQNLKGQLPSEDSLIYAEHGLEYWVSHFSKYQCQKISSNVHGIDDLYEQLEEINTTDTYLVTNVQNPMIPIVQESTGIFEANTFTLNTPLNNSVHSNPMVVSCETPPSSPTFQIHYYLYDYMTKGLQWQRLNVTSKAVLERNKHIKDGSVELWNYIQSIVYDAVDKGYLKE